IKIGYFCFRKITNKLPIVPIVPIAGIEIYLNMIVGNFLNIRRAVFVRLLFFNAVGLVMPQQNPTESYDLSALNCIFIVL
ncbi:MAG TPA: hypothetical protein VJY41_12565, partial [Prolixibacteraceae bacterium]|nr:hypothetical protein [Prolixibacteraceae bacterium]